MIEMAEKPRTETDSVCVKIDDEAVCTLARKKIVLTDGDKGRLLDGREVVKVEGKWYYIPRSNPGMGEVCKCADPAMNLGRGLEILHRGIIDWSQDPDKNRLVAASSTDQLVKWVEDVEKCSGAEMPITKDLAREIGHYARTSERAENVGVSLEVERRLKAVLYEELKKVCEKQ